MIVRVGLIQAINARLTRRSAVVQRVRIKQVYLPRKILGLRYAAQCRYKNE